MISAEKKKIGRNDPCICGSGKKYKKCCLVKESLEQGVDIPSKIQEAVKHHKAGDLEAAEIIYHRVLSLEKNNANALHLLGEIAYQRKNYASAVDYIHQAININQTSPVVYTNLGNALRETGKNEEAIDAFIHAIDLKEDHLPAYEGLADLIRRENHLNERSLRYFMMGLVQEEIRPESKYGMLVMLGYVIESSREWNKTLFEKCIIPATKDALEREDYLLGYYLNALTAICFAQQPHTSEQWKSVHDLTNPMYISAGEKLRKNLDDLVLPDVSDDLPVIGFIVDLSIGSGSGAVLLLNLLRGFSILRPLPFQVIVYTLDRARPDFNDVCSETGVKLVDLSRLRGNLSSETDFLQRILTLRGLIQEDNVRTLVYPGTYEAFPCLAASMGLAPVQIYLSIGFRSLSIPMIHGYVTFGSPAKSSKILHGRSWRTGPTPMPDPYPLEGSEESLVLNQEVDDLRKKYFGEYQVILGSIGRAQKIDNSSFMDVLSRIMKANPKSVYLWFGSKELPSVRHMMEERGISDRCLFQGWVEDARLYGKLLDIHLDSFPFASGHAMLESMSAGTAYVWMRCDQTEAVGMSAELIPFLDKTLGTKEEQDKALEIFTCPQTGENLALLAHSEDEYVKYTQGLIDDADFRAAVGNAGRHFMEEFKHDLRSSAKAFLEHFLEIIDEYRMP